MLRRTVAAIGLGLVALPLSAAPRFAVKTIPVGNSPGQLLASPLTGRVYVACTDSGRVVVLDPTRERVEREIPTAAKPLWLSWDSLRDNLLVVEAEYTEGGARGVVESFAAGNGTYALVGAVDTDVINLTSAEYDATNDRLILLEGVASGPPVPMGIVDVGSFAFARNSQLSPGNSFQVLVDTSTRRIIVPELRDDAPRLARVRVLDADTFHVLYMFGGGILQTAYSPVYDRLYMLNPYTETIWAQQIADPNVYYYASVGREPRSLVLDEPRERLYVANNASNFVSSIDLSQVVSGYFPSTELPIPLFARTIKLDAARNRLYAVAHLQTAVSVLDTTTGALLGTLGVGAQPRVAAVDARSGKLVTANGSSGTVSFIATVPEQMLSGAVTAVPDAIPADAPNPSRITVGPLGAPGLAVEIATTGGSLVGSVTDVGDGTYTQDLVATGVVGTAIVSATAEGIPLDAHPHVAFTRDGWPVLLRLEPEWGIIAGNTEVHLTGSGFTSQGAVPLGTPRVHFGTDEAEVLSATDTEIVCLTPAHAAGVVDVSVTINVSGQDRAAVLNDGYTYVEDSNIGALNPLKLTERGVPAGNVRLNWGTSPSGPVRMVRSTSRNFTADRAETPGLAGPDVTDSAPAFPQVIYYKIER